MKCEDCRYFVIGESGYQREKGLGYCHRNPPQIANDGDGDGSYPAFPRVSKTEWCGEYDPTFDETPSDQILTELTYEAKADAEVSKHGC